MSRPSSEPYDLVRTLRMAGYGFLILGPSLHYWFNFISKLFPKRDLITTFKKIILGQTTYGPVMTVVFFSVNARLQGKNEYLLAKIECNHVLFAQLHWRYFLKFIFCCGSFHYCFVCVLLLQSYLIDSK